MTDTIENLNVGQAVRIRNPNSPAYNLKGHVVRINEDGLYVIAVPGYIHQTATRGQLQLTGASK